MRLRSILFAAFLPFSIFFSNIVWGQVPSTVPVDGIRELGVPNVVLTGATVVVEPGVVRDNCSIVIRDAKIVDLGTTITIPTGALVIDLQGKTIYPGFIESYSEAEFPAQALDQGSPYWNAQIGPERAMGLVYKADPEKLAKFRKAGFTSILVAPASGIVRGTSCIVATLDEKASSAMQKSKAADHVRLTVARRFSPGGGAGGVEQRYPNSPMGAVALARQTFLDAQWYRAAWQAYRAQPNLPQPELNSSLDALREWRESLRPTMFDAGNEQYAMRADQFAREFGLPAVIRGSGREYRMLDEMRRLGRAMIIPVNFPKPPDVSSSAVADDVTLGDMMHWELAPENPARLIHAGIKIAFTTDGLNDPSEWLEHVRTAIDRGLDRDAALAALTTQPAKTFGIDDQVGTIQVGKWASFVVADGNLWDRKTKIVETWVQGKRFSWQDTPMTEWSGNWSISLAENQDLPTSLTLHFDSGSKVGGTLRVPDADDKNQGGGDNSESVGDSESSAAEPNDAATTKETELHQHEADPQSTEASSDPSPSDVKSSEDAAESSKAAAPAPPDTASPQEGQPPMPELQEGKAGEASPAPSKAPSDASAKSAEPEKREARLESVRTQDLRLSAQFAVKKLIASKEGMAQLSGSQLSDGDARKLVGSIVWPDGSTSPFIATAMAETPEKQADAPEKQDAVQQQPSQADRPAAGNDRPMTRGRGRGGPPGARGPAEVASDASSSNGEKDTKASKILSQPNYPFGEFGRLGLPAQSEWVHVRGATIWTCSDAGIIDNGELLVHRGVIKAIGKSLEVPDGALTIDAHGMHLSPGLIDCHSHMATDGGVNESGQAVTAEVRIGDFIDAEDISIYRQLAGGLTCANILHGSANPIGGQNQVIKLRWGGNYHDLKFREAPAGIKFALGENVTRANSSGGEGPVRYPRSRMGVDELYRDRFEAAREYDRAHKEWSQHAQGLPPRRDLELEALAEILRGERWIHCHSYRQDEILAFLRMLEDFGVTIGSLQHILEGYKVADVLAKHGATASSFSDWWAYKMEVYDAIPYNGALLHNAGVIVSFNSDDAELARHMNHEAAKAVKYGGVPPEEALKFVTLNPAKQLRIDSMVGSLEVGKHADFVLWSGSPLSVMSRCEQTWIDGRKFFDREEDLQVRKAVAELRSQLTQKILASGSEMARPGERPFDPSAEWPRHDEFCHHHHDDDREEHEHE